jgi:hypothetical protein
VAPPSLGSVTHEVDELAGHFRLHRRESGLRASLRGALLFVGTDAAVEVLR